MRTASHTSNPELQSAPPESRRLFLPNFDFEAGLSSPSGQRSREASRRNSELAFAWLAVARPGDAILVDELPGPDFDLQSLGRLGIKFLRSPQQPQSSIGNPSPELVPWGWDKPTCNWAESLTLPFKAPPLDVVARVNSREFSYLLELEFGCGLPGQAICRSSDEVEQAVRPWPRWLLKGNFSSAGRDRLAGAGPLDERSASWVARRLERDGVVLVEPFLESIAEVGIQWEIPRPPEPPDLIGVVPLLCDERGQYRGSVIVNDDSLLEYWRPAVETTRRAVTHFQSLGYFGPVGIDAMRYRDAGGAIRIRPLQDINARWTMGRLALGWRDRIPEGARGVLSSGPEAFSNPETIRISPQALGGKPVRHVFSLCVERLEADTSPQSTI